MPYPATLSEDRLKWLDGELESIEAVWTRLGLLPVVSFSDLKHWENLRSWSRDAYTAYARRTQEAFHSDWIVFCRWCAVVGRNPLPADPQTLKLFLYAHIALPPNLPADLTDQAEATMDFLDEHGVDRVLKPVKMATLERYLSSISMAHRAAEALNPRESETVRLARKTCRRLASVRQEQKAGFRLDYLRELASLPSQNMREEQDVLMALVAFQTGARSQTLADMQVDWLHWEDNGICVVEIKRSKTDQEGAGEYRVLSEPTSARLAGWLKGDPWRLDPNERNVDAEIKAGPLFRGILGKNTRMHLLNEPISTKSIREAAKRLARRMGLPSSDISSHSFRIGGAQELAESGADTLEIMRYGGWKSERMPARYTEKVRASQAKIVKLTKDL